MHLSKVRFGIVFFVFAMFFVAIGAGTALAVQTHMVNARADLQAALNQLNMAVPDKGGHRANAIGLVNNAINQVNLGISAAQ